MKWVNPPKEIVAIYHSHLHALGARMKNVPKDNGGEYVRTLQSLVESAQGLFLRGIIDNHNPDAYMEKSTT